MRTHEIFRLASLEECSMPLVVNGTVKGDAGEIRNRLVQEMRMRNPSFPEQPAGDGDREKVANLFSNQLLMRKNKRINYFYY